MYPGLLLAQTGKGIDGVLIFVLGSLLIKRYRFIQILRHAEALLVENTEFITGSDDARSGFSSRATSLALLK